MIVHVRFSEKQYAAIKGRAEADGLAISAVIRSAVVIMLRLNAPRYKVTLPADMLKPIVPAPEDHHADI